MSRAAARRRLAEHWVILSRSSDGNRDARSGARPPVTPRGWSAGC